MRSCKSSYSRLGGGGKLGFASCQRWEPPGCRMENGHCKNPACRRLWPAPRICTRHSALAAGVLVWLSFVVLVRAATPGKSLFGQLVEDQDPWRPRLATWRCSQHHSTGWVRHRRCPWDRHFSSLSQQHHSPRKSQAQASEIASSHLYSSPGPGRMHG